MAVPVSTPAEHSPSEPNPRLGQLLFATDDNLERRCPRNRDTALDHHREAESSSGAVAGQHSVQAPGDAAADEHPVGGGRRRHRLSVRPQLAACRGLRPPDRDPPVAEQAAALRGRGPEELAGDLLAGLHRDPGRRGVHDGLRRTRPVHHLPGPATVARRLLHQPVRAGRGRGDRRPPRRRALLPTSNAQRYLQAYYTAPFSDWDKAIKFDDARDGSAWSAANAQFNDFFREIVTRFEFEDALLLDTRGNVVYSAYKGVDLGTNIFTGPFKGSNLTTAYQRRSTPTSSTTSASPTSATTNPPTSRPRGSSHPSARRAASRACWHCSFRSPRSTA